MYRVVNSTLAAESQNLSKGLSELAWSVTVYKDLITEGFDLKEWQRALKDQRVMTLAKDDMDETLKQSPCVVDAKSLWSFGGSRSSKSSERAAGAAEAGSSGSSRVLLVVPGEKIKESKGPDNPTSQLFSDNQKKWLKRHGKRRKDKGDGGGPIILKIVCEK